MINGNSWFPSNQAVAVAVTLTGSTRHWELLISDTNTLLVREWYADREVAKLRAEEFILDRLWREPGAFQWMGGR